MDSSSNIERLISSIHKTIRDGDYERLVELIEQADSRRVVSASSSSRCKNILWEPNSSGWTAVHFAAAHFLPLEWWEWILRRAADDNNNNDETGIMSWFAFHHEHQRAALGQTVLDIFLKSFFDPFPWQSEAIQNRSRQLLQALKLVLGEDRFMQEIQQELGQRRQQSGPQRPQPNTHTHPIIAHRPPSCTVAVHRVVSFLQYLECLCRHCAPATEEWRKGAAESTMKDHRSMPLLHVCCHFMSGGSSSTTFPGPLAQLLLALDPEAPRHWRQVYVSNSTKIDDNDKNNNNDRSGCRSCWFLPLHSWASNTNAHTMPHHSPSSPTCSHDKNCDGDNHLVPETNDDTLVSSLLTAYAESAQMTPRMELYAKEGTAVTRATRREELPQPIVVTRLPLHMALAAGRSWYHGVQSLFRAFPGSVQCIDPVTHLFPVALAAATAHDHTRTNNLPVAAEPLNVSSSSSSRSFHYSQEVILVRARQICAGEKGLSAMWQLVPPERRHRAIQTAEHELDCEHLTTIFELLRAYPRALDCCDKSKIDEQ